MGGGSEARQLLYNSECHPSNAVGTVLGNEAPAQKLWGPLPSDRKPYPPPNANPNPYVNPNTTLTLFNPITNSNNISDNTTLTLSSR